MVHEDGSVDLLGQRSANKMAISFLAPSSSPNFFVL